MTPVAFSAPLCGSVDSMGILLLFAVLQVVTVGWVSVCEVSPAAAASRKQRNKDSRVCAPL